MNRTTAEATSTTTRDALLDAGTALILEKGYNHCGVGEILRLAGSNKGSFYHHFRNKEDFGLRLVDRYARERFAALDRYLDDDRTPPLERLRRFFEDSCRRHEAMGFRRGCLFGNLGQEMADQSEAFRRRLCDCLTRLRERIAGCLREAQARGELATGLDADRLADYCLNSWEGAVLRMKVVRSLDPLEEFLRVTFGVILKAP